MQVAETVNWSFPREDISIRESISQIALAIRDEVLDLEKNGIKMIQIDEAALREKLPLRRSDWHSEYLDFAIPAFRLTHSGVKPDCGLKTRAMPETDASLRNMVEAAKHYK